MGCTNRLHRHFPTTRLPRYSALYVKSLSFRARLTLLALFWPCTFAATAPAQSTALQVDFDAHGLKRLSYKGRDLEDRDRWPVDSFAIGHMKATDVNGKPLKGGQYDWGENRQNSSFDLATKTWRYNYSWGSIRLQYTQVGDELNLRVTTENNSHSGIIFDGASIVPLTLHLPRVPVAFGLPADSHYEGNIEEPAIVLADYGEAEVMCVATDPALPAYVGFRAHDKDFTYSPIVATTAPDGFNEPEHPDRMLKPGQTDTFTASLRFAPSKTPRGELAKDAYEAFAKRYPSTLHWNDHRIIGTVFLSSSPQGDKTRPAGFPTNPRRYFTDNSIDINTPEGLSHFQSRILQQARDIVDNLKRLHAQGAITWDVEGEQYPQDTSYACSPDQIARLSPEMESIILDKHSPWNGLKLDDAYFKIIQDAGFKIGVCVRPQRLVVSSDGAARQVTLSDAEAAVNLVQKMKYAHDRWGATLFYLDSTVEADGKTLPAAILEQAAEALPDSLLIPEESSPRMYRSTAPFRTFLFHGDVGPESTAYLIYPDAFSTNLINDVDPDKLRDGLDQLTKSVKSGDILMLLASYWQANNATAVQVYRDATSASR